MKPPGEERTNPMSLQIPNQTKMTFTEAMTAFLDYAASQKVTARTYCFYVNTFRNFAAFIKDADTIDIDVISQETIKSFLATAADTFNDRVEYYHGLRALWDWTYRRQVVSADIMSEIPRPPEYEDYDGGYNARPNHPETPGGNAVDLHLAASVQSLAADSVRLTEENIRLQSRLEEMEQRTDQLNVYQLNKQLTKLMNVVRPSETDVYELNKRLDHLHLQLLTQETAYRNPGRIPVLLFTTTFILLAVIIAALATGGFMLTIGTGGFIIIAAGIILGFLMVNTGPSKRVNASMARLFGWISLDKLTVIIGFLAFILTVLSVLIPQ